jgi:hypothetical protein
MSKPKPNARSLSLHIIETTSIAIGWLMAIQQLLLAGNVSWRAIRRARPPTAGPRARLIAAARASLPPPTQQPASSASSRYMLVSVHSSFIGCTPYLRQNRHPPPKYISLYWWWMMSIWWWCGAPCTERARIITIAPFTHESKSISLGLMNLKLNKLKPK